jgi:hypothetical protein
MTVVVPAWGIPWKTTSLASGGYWNAERQQSPISGILYSESYGFENLNAIVACSISFLPRGCGLGRIGCFNRTAWPKYPCICGSSGPVVTNKWVGIVEGDVAFKWNSVPCTEELESVVWLYCDFNSRVMGREVVLSGECSCGWITCVVGTDCMSYGIIMYPVCPTTRVVGPKAFPNLFTCALPSFVVCNGGAGSLLICHCFTLSFNLYAASSLATLV